MQVRRRARTGWLLVLGLWLSVSAALWAQADPNDDSVHFTLRVLADHDDGFDAAEVLAGAHDQHALPAQDGPINLGYPRHPWWAVFELRNTSAQEQSRELVLWRGAAHTQQAYLQSADGDGAQPLDFERGFTRHAVLSASLPAHSSQRIAVRLASTSALSLDYRLLSVQQLAGTDRIDYWFFGMLAGVVFAIAIYVLALYFAVRDTLYLQFAGFAICILIYQLHTEGYAYVLWGEHARWPGTLVAAYSGALFLILLVQFIRNFMQIDTQLPWVDRWLLRPSVVLVCTVFPLFLIRPWLGNTMAALSGILVALVGGAAVILAARKTRPEWSLVFGVLLFTNSGIVHLLRRIGVLADSQMLSLLLQLSSAVLMISFAIAVMSRIRRIVTENRESQARHARQLESEVAERTAELQHAKEAAEQALASLQATQQQLVQSEKMASLGQLVAGVAHEVNTPLGICVTVSSHLADQVAGLRKRFVNGIKRSDLDTFISESEQASALIQSNLARAAELVRSFKKVAVDQSSEDRRKFHLAGYIAEVLTSLGPQLKRSKIKASIDGDRSVEMDSYPGVFAQIITNLTINAATHAFDGEGGSIQILLGTEGDRLNLMFRDDGKGMSEEVRQRVFDPFFTTRRGQGGSGLGLHITYNQVTQQLGGTIRCESRPGQGTQFYLAMPLKTAESRDVV